MKLDYYKSDKGIYVARENISYLNRRELLGNHKPILINGKAPEKTNHVSWLFISGESELLSLSAKVTGERHNYRWELKESTPALVADTLPKVITKEDASEYCDDYEYYIGKECEHHEYQNFYTRKHDVKPDYFKDSEVEISFLGTIKSNWVDSPLDARYSVWKSSYESDGDETIAIQDVASFSELSKMLTPDLLIHNQPCGLSSLLTYKIIRKYVSDNIHPMCARITSDYDFCFTVKKKIAIKPFVVKTEKTKANGRSYAKPRITTRSVTHTEEQIFEMTHLGRGGNYKGYTAISGFRGDSLKGLVGNIESYLFELMSHINSQLSQCDKCNGTGHLAGEHFDVNKR